MKWVKDVITLIKGLCVSHEPFVDDMIIGFNYEYIDPKLLNEPNPQLWNGGSDRLLSKDIAFELYLKWYGKNQEVALHGEDLLTYINFNFDVYDGKYKVFFDDAEIIIRRDKIKKIISKMNG